MGEVGGQRERCRLQKRQQAHRPVVGSTEVQLWTQKKASECSKVFVQQMFMKQHLFLCWALCCALGA